ncbi:hypothetical protein ACOMHN_063060 [Nucella lapillus]
MKTMIPRLCLYQVAGDNPRALLTKADLPPPSPHTSTFFNDTQFFASNNWEFHNPRTQDSGVYLCQGQSSDGQGHVVRRITLTVVRVAKVVRSMTGLTTYTNGSLVGVCTAGGVPLPTVNISACFDNGPNAVVDEADIRVTQLNETTSQATMFVSDLRKYERYDVIENIFCIVGNANDWDDYLHMDVEEENDDD